MQNEITIKLFGAKSIELVILYRSLWNLFDTFLLYQLAKGAAGGQAGYRCPLSFNHWWGKLQLALCVPLRLPDGWGEDRDLQEGVYVRLGWDRVQNPSTSQPPSVGCRSLLCRWFPRCSIHMVPKHSRITRSTPPTNWIHQIFVSLPRCNRTRP